MEDSRFSMAIEDDFLDSPQKISYPADSHFEKSIRAFEKETDQKVAKTISSIEKALSSWDSIRKKPKSLLKTVNSLKSFKKAISDWERKAIKARNQEITLDARITLLNEFSDVC